MKIERKTIIYSTLFLGGLLVLLFAPYPQLFTSGNTQCAFCIGDCWDEMEQGCSELYQTQGLFWFLETYDLEYSYCESRHCKMLIRIYCTLQDYDFIELEEHSYTIECTAYNCFVCDPN